jgi:hypothetical protein
MTALYKAIGVQLSALSIVCRPDFVNYSVYVGSIIERRHGESCSGIARVNVGFPPK